MSKNCHYEVEFGHFINEEGRALSASEVERIGENEKLPSFLVITIQFQDKDERMAKKTAKEKIKDFLKKNGGSVVTILPIKFRKVTLLNLEAL